MGKKIDAPSVKTAQQTAMRRFMNDAIHDRVRFIDEHQLCKSNSFKAAALNKVHAERLREKVNEDGTRMTVTDQIEYRERTGYGDEKTIESLREKLKGVKSATDEMSDEELLAALG